MNSANILALLQKCTTTMAELKQIHAQTITNGLSRFTFIRSRVLAFCALSQNGDIDYARTVFNQIPMPSVFDFNSLIAGFSYTSLPEKGLSQFSQMRRIGVEPNHRTFTCLVKCCACLVWLDQLHGQIIKFGHRSDVYVISSAISMYSKCGAMELARQVFDESADKNVVCWTALITGYSGHGLVNDARNMFDAMPERNEVSYSAMVSGYVSNGFFHEAIELFRELKSCSNVRFNGSLLVCILDVCAVVGAFQEGKFVHSYVKEHGFEYEMEIGTALIDFYAKFGCIEDAVEIFSKLPYKDVTTWSAIILGMAINGENNRALELFSEMEKKGPPPNAVTLVAVLAACNHRIFASKAWWYFSRMSKVYGIAPKIEHYGCMVDLLARAGLVKEAMTLINSMPMEPDAAIWNSLLNGCMMHSHVAMGERVGKVLIELKPQHSGRYVLVSNMHASKGSWEEVMRIREMMKERGVVTISAWSFIEIEGLVHKFLADDRAHSCSRGIYAVLDQLSNQLACYSVLNDAFLCKEETSLCEAES